MIRLESGVNGELRTRSALQIEILSSLRFVLGALFLFVSGVLFGESNDVNPAIKVQRTNL
jgi:hypothetical protein